MPPIPVHIDAPIIPQKPDGVTPQTKGSASSGNPSAVVTTTTSITTPYLAARPGQAVGPAPTAAIPRPQPEPTRTSGSSEQRGDEPPAPQPSAVPRPMATPEYTALPPPPLPGQQAPITTMPAQLQTSPPYQNYAPTHSTITNFAQQQRGGMGPTTLNMGPVSSPVASGPPGYQQDVYAQDLSSAQRASLDQQQRRESLASGGLVNSLGLGNGGNSLGGGLGASAGFKENGAAPTAGDMWTSVKSWANTAGEKLAETEKAVWDRVNKG